MTFLSKLTVAIKSGSTKLSLGLEGEVFEDINKSSISKLTEAIGKSSALNIVYLNGNIFSKVRQGDKLQNTLLNAILQHPNLSSLVLDNLTLTIDQVQLIAARVSLKSLVLDNCPLTDAMALIILSNRSITTLAIIKCGITGGIAKELAESNTLEEVDFRENNFSTDAVIEILSGSNNLARIRLTTTDLTEANATRIETALKTNTRLTNISLGDTFQLTNMMRLCLGRNKKNSLEIWTQLYLLLEKEPLDASISACQLPGIDPNGHWFNYITKVPTANPILNYWIANEFEHPALRLILCSKNTLDPNQLDYEDKNALITAAKFRFPKIVKTLLESFPEIHLDAQDKEGNTALHYGYLFGELEIIKELEKKNPRQDILNKANQTPRDCLSCSEKEIAEILHNSQTFPLRDSKANFSRLLNYLQLRGIVDPKEFYNQYLVTKNNLIQASKDTLTFITSNKATLSAEDLKSYKDAYASIVQIQKTLSGIPLIDVIMENKEKTQKWLDKKDYPISTELHVDNDGKVTFTIQFNMFLTQAKDCQQKEKAESSQEFSSVGSIISSIS